jgi:Flp pilus assembly pilin Flp
MLTKLNKMLKKKSKAQTAIEYALIVGGMAFTLFTLLEPLKKNVGEGTQKLGENIKKVIETGKVEQ